MLAKRKSILNMIFLALPVLSICITYVIVNYGNNTGYFFVLSFIGIALSLFFILFPVFGFYFTIVFSFFVFDIGRYFKVDLPLGTLVDYLIISTFVGVLLKKLLVREYFWKNCNHPIIYIYLIYSIYTLIQFFNPNTESFQATLLVVRKFFVLLLFLYCAIQLFTDLESIRRFFKIWISVALIAALYACFEKWFGLTKYHSDYIFSDPYLVGLYRLNTGGFRIFSFLSDPRDLGFLMAASALISLILLLNVKKNFKRIIFLIATTIFYLLAMSFSGTRTANFMLVVGLFLYILMTIANFKTLIFSCFATIAFIIIIYGPIYGNPTINRIRSTFDVSKEESLKVRDFNRHSIQPYIYAHGIGGGLGTTGIAYVEYNTNHPLMGFPTDSGLLRIALETGWVGMIITFFVYFIILQQGVHAYYRSRNPRYKKYFLVAVVALFSYMAAQYSQVAIGQAPGIFLYYSLIAIIIRLRQLELTGSSET